VPQIDRVVLPRGTAMIDLSHVEGKVGCHNLS